MVPVPTPASQGGPLRVLWLIDSLTLGGAESLAVAFARAADPTRLHLHVAFLKRIAGNPYEEELRRLGIPLTHLAARHLRDLAALRRLLRLLRVERIDLVHAHLTYAATWGALAARLTAVPCLASLHLPPSPESAWSRPGLRERLMAFLLRRWSAGAIAVSGAVREAYVRRGLLDPSRVAVVHNGIDLTAFAEAPAAARAEHRRELDLPPEAKLVTTVSVLREGKGLEVLLRAASAVLDSDPRARILVVGDGPLAPTLHAQARQAGLGEGVRWAGFRRDVPSLLAASDLFVLPSLRDAFPTVLLEAMAAGLAVVATRTGGVPEIVADGHTGVLVPPGDAPALARAVAQLLASPEKRTTLGEAGRRRAFAEFSSPAWVGRLEDVYRQAATGARSHE